MPDDRDGSQASSTDHFVYLYRDERGRPLYVGYGKEPPRSTSHQRGSHNEELNRFLDGRTFKVEIGGPYDSKDMGLAVETALISVLQPEFNRNPGRSEWRFRPLAVPLEYADRYAQRNILLEDFLKEQGSDPAPVLFVIVNDQDSKDGRIGYNLASPPSDPQIRERLEKWWQLHKYLSEWAATPYNSPGLLVGVHGSPGAQFVVAAIRIDQEGWDKAESRKGGKVRVPLADANDLDAFGFRGRRVAREAVLSFGNWSSQFYIVLGRDGVARGGRSSRR